MGMVVSPRSTCSSTPHFRFSASQCFNFSSQPFLFPCVLCLEIFHLNSRNTSNESHPSFVTDSYNGYDALTLGVWDSEMLSIISVL